jgi:ABC-2 type transport system permease protein
MRRLFLIARREYFAYARTIGFWLSMLVLPAFVVLGGMLPGYMKNASPVRAVAIVDMTGQAKGPQVVAAMDRLHLVDQASSMRQAAAVEAGPDKANEVRDIAEAQGVEAGAARLRQVAPNAGAGWKPEKRAVVLAAPPPEVAAARSVAEAEAALKPYVNGDRKLADGRALDGAAILTLEDGEVAARFWSKGVTDTRAEDEVRDALEEVIRADRLAAAGVSAEQARSFETIRPKLDVFSTKSASGEAVGIRDRLPGLVGFIFGMLLWSTVITGASILMNSVMEEKSNRVLEVLLSSASTTEILAGKVLGVAGITATVLGVWGALGALILSSFAAAAPGLVQDFVSVLTGEGLLIYLLIYLVGGYLMYAVLFAAIGAFCETPREAQTLLGPIMILLSAPIIVMQLAIRTPDMAVVKFLSWVPLFTPFLMPARVPADPPMIEIVGTMLGMFLTAALMVWIGGKAFRAGALSTAKLDWKGLVGLLRREG